MIVVAKLKARQGQEEKLEQAMRGVVPDVEKEEGTLVYTLHRSSSDPSVYMFYEKYRDGDAFSHHSSTPHFKALARALAELLEGQLEIEFYEELAAIAK